MFDKEAIEELSKAQAIAAACSTVDASVGATDGHGVAALPDDFSMHDLEKYLPNRRRARGTMSTRMISDFAAYINDHKEEGAAVFVSVDDMKATAVLNLGTPHAAGHADNKAVFTAKATAAFAALSHITQAGPCSQVKVAEFLEDWSDDLACSFEGGDIKTPLAVIAMRNITIEGMRNVQSTEGQLQASKSTFEQVKASSKEQIPTIIKFTCEPYSGLPVRSFYLRLGINTGGDKPTITLRVIKLEEHQEQMGKELASLIQTAVAGAVPVMLGSYAAA